MLTETSDLAIISITPPVGAQVVHTAHFYLPAIPGGYCGWKEWFRFGFSSRNVNMFQIQNPSTCFKFSWSGAYIILVVSYYRNMSLVAGGPDVLCRLASGSFCSLRCTAVSSTRGTHLLCLAA
jgi:hypothetical protein